MPDTNDAEPRQRQQVETRLEASTMALYVSVVLLAALVALRGSPNPTQRVLLEVIWGTTLGLALAHLYAFRVSSRLVRGRSFDRGDLKVAAAQLGGATAVAMLCTVPVVVFPSPSEDDMVRLLLGALLGAGGYSSGRAGGASRLRSLVLGAAVLAVGFGVALVKNSMSGH
ncbi:MAG: hypothetical protein WAN48_05785 [Actinomycetes bacterium]